MQSVLTDHIKVVKDGNVTTPKGFTAGGLHCGIKKTQI